MISEHSRPSEQRVISGVTILAFGEQSIKYDQNYSQQRVVPLMGLDTSISGVDYKQLAVGMLFPDSRNLLGLGSRKLQLSLTGGCVIQAWRAMKVLEKMSRVEEESAQFAVDVMTPRIESWNPEFYNHQAYHLGKGLRDFEALKQELLQQVPPQLDRILASMQREGVSPHAPELEHEVNIGNLIPSPIVQYHLDELADRRMKAPLRTALFLGENVAF